MVLLLQPPPSRGKAGVVQVTEESVSQTGLHISMANATLVNNTLTFALINPNYVRQNASLYFWVLAIGPSLSAHWAYLTPQTRSVPIHLRVYDPGQYSVFAIMEYKYARPGPMELHGPYWPTPYVEAMEKTGVGPYREKFPSHGQCPIAMPYVGAVLPKARVTLAGLDQLPSETLCPVESDGRWLAVAPGDRPGSPRVPQVPAASTDVLNSGPALPSNASACDLLAFPDWNASHSCRFTWAPHGCRLQSAADLTPTALLHAGMQRLVLAGDSNMRYIREALDARSQKSWNRTVLVPALHFFRIDLFRYLLRLLLESLKRDLCTSHCAKLPCNAPSHVATWAWVLMCGCGGPPARCSHDWS